jgi:hypothetical protein
MPRAPIVTVELPIPPRAGAEFLRPFYAPEPNERRPAPWDLNRRPYPVATHVAAGGRLGRLHLGQEPEQREALEAALPPTTQPATAPSSPRSPTLALPECPPAQTIAFNFTVPGASTQIAAVSYGPIPYSYRITGAAAAFYGPDVGYAAWNLYLTDTPYNGLVDTIEGQPLIEARTLNAFDPPEQGYQTNRGLLAGSLFQGPDGDFHYLPLNALVTDLGRYLTAAVETGEITTPKTFEILVSVQQCGAPPQPTVPRVTTRTSTPTQPRAAPTPPPPPPQALAAPPTLPPPPQARPVYSITQPQTAAQARQNAEILRQLGNEAQARAYEDLANAMERRRPLTPAQEALLSPWSTYQREILGLPVLSPAGTPERTTAGTRYTLPPVFARLASMGVRIG